MKPNDIIYIALICFVVAVVLWAYFPWEGENVGHHKNLFERFKHFLFQHEKGVVYRGGNKKRRKRRERPFKKYPKRSPFWK